MEMDQPIRVNKTIALLLIIASIIFFLTNVGRTLLTHQMYENGVSGGLAAYATQLQIGILFFSYLVQFGLLWVLITFKENAFVKSGVIVEMIAGIFMFGFSMMIPTLAARNAWGYQSIAMAIGIFNLIITLYLIVTYFCVQNRSIKTVFVIYGVVLLITNAIVYAASLMDNVGIKWTVQMMNYTLLVPLIMPIVVFIRVYNLGDQQLNSDPYLQKPAAPFTFNQDKQP
jgi:hypothetical protein